MYETTPPSLTLSSSSPSNYQTIPIPYNRIDSFSSSMTTLHHLNPNQNNTTSIMNNLLHYSRETNNPNNNNNNNNDSIITQISSKCDDGYGFLWNMDLEENSLVEEDGVASNLDAIRFEVDNNNMVML
jgi:hypothetical protein